MAILPSCMYGAVSATLRSVGVLKAPRSPSLFGHDVSTEVGLRVAHADADVVIEVGADAVGSKHLLKLLPVSGNPVEALFDSLQGERHLNGVLNRSERLVLQGRRSAIPEL